MHFRQCLISWSRFYEPLLSCCTCSLSILRFLIPEVVLCTLKDMDHWGAVIEAVKATVQFLVHYPSLMHTYIQPIMSTACKLLLAIYPLFSSEVIAQDLDEAEYDSDGDNTDLQMLVSQVCIKSSLLRTVTLETCETC